MKSKVVIGLEECIERQGTGCVLYDEYGINRVVEKKEIAGEDKVGFLVIDARVEHPVYQFWRLADADVLEDNCHIVFTDVEDSTTWKDLVDCYGGLRFGSLFLMVYRESTRVGVFPSQRGMYMK